MTEPFTPNQLAAEPRRDTREQILEATRIALARDGYENITTRRIAEEAGVNIATLHYYFGTKEALLHEAVQYNLQRLEQRLRAAIQNVPDARTALERAFYVAWDTVQERAGVIRFDLVVKGLRNSVARQQVLGIYAELRRLVEEILEGHLKQGGRLADNVTVEQAAYYLVTSVDGVVLQHLLLGQDDLTWNSLRLILRHGQSLMLPPESGDDSVTEDTKG